MRFVGVAALTLMMGCAPAGPINPAASSNPATIASTKLPQGDGRFVFDGWAGPALRVWTHVPAQIGKETPIVIVMHGRGRDADRYRDEWKDLAEAEGFILAVPEFDAERFPGSNSYNHGWFREADGTPRPREQWSFAAIEPLFDEVKNRSGSQVKGYALYGHSAGAQFVHRFVLLMPEARYNSAVTANAGSYAFPDFNVGYPFGLKGAPIDERGLKQVLGKPVVVLLGTADNDINHKSLPQQPQAKKQGAHRLARGEAFFAAGKQSAHDLGVPFGWRLRHVPGVAHSNDGMARAAAPLLGEKK